MGEHYLGARPLRPKKNTHARPLPIVSTCAILCTRVLPKSTLPNNRTTQLSQSSFPHFLGVVNLPSNMLIIVAFLSRFFFTYLLVHP